MFTYVNSEEDDGKTKKYFKSTNYRVLINKNLGTAYGE